MRITVTDGKVIEYPDMCACCELTTGGGHQPHCPLFQQSQQIVAEQPPKPFVLMSLRCPWCGRDMIFHGYKEV